MAPTAWLLSACGSGPDLMSSVALPSQQTANIVGGVGGDSYADLAASPSAQSELLEVTPAQRGYLDALSEAGIRPSTELRALSIGSYVCQARAAGRNEHAIREYVGPMVRSDVADATAAAPQAVTPLAADATITDYIRIATERLC